MPCRFPRVAGGRPFSASPVREVPRLPLPPRADPASLQRLAVYPWRDGEIVGTGLEGGENGRVFCREVRVFREVWVLGSSPRMTEEERGEGGKQRSLCPAVR